ncbi:MAG: hypothetical protein ABJB66_06760, partial [Gemmatimonadaceae bacterium]
SAPASVSLSGELKKRSWVERAKRYFTGADLDEAEVAGLKTNTRIADDLPPQVAAVATAQLITNGLSALSGIAVAAGAVIFAVGSPLYFGRVGVGYSLVALFGGSVLAVVTAIPFFTARGAARILRRDPRGIKPVLRWAWLVAIGSALAIAGFLLPAISSDVLGTKLHTLSFTRGLISVLSSLVFEVWTIVTLRKYRKEVAAEIASAEAENVSESERPANASVTRGEVGGDRPIL